MKQQTSTRSNDLSKLKISATKKLSMNYPSGGKPRTGFGTSFLKSMDLGLVNSQNTMGSMGNLRLNPTGATRYLESDILSV